MSSEGGSGWGLVAALAGAFLIGRASRQEPSPGEKLKRDGIRYLRSVIQQWRPVNCETEADYQLALQNHLLGHFSEDGLVATREWGSGKSRIDIVVEDKYGIELKLDLLDEGETKRLIGQVNSMKKSLVGGLVVLCGQVQEEQLRRLEQEFREYDEQENLVFDVVAIPRFLPD